MKNSNPSNQALWKTQVWQFLSPSNSRNFFFIENYLLFMKNCIRPHYEKLKPLKSGFIENSNFENNRDPWGWWTVLSKRSKNQYPVEWKSIYGSKAMIRGRSSFTSSSRVKDVANRLNLEKKSNEDSPALVHWTLSWSLGLWARLLSALQQGIFRDEVEDWRTSWWQ